MGKMKSRLKRFVVWCMAAVMLCMSGPFTANAAALECETPELAAAKTVKIKNAKVGTKVTVGNYTYRITALTPKKKTVEVTGFTKKAKKKRTEVMVPASIKITSKTGKYKGTYSFKVTSVGKKAFYNNKKIWKVTLGNNIRTVKKQAFYGCTNLLTLIFYDASNLKVFEAGAFQNCRNLYETNLDNQNLIMKKIGKNALKNTEIKNNPYFIKTKKKAKKIGNNQMVLSESYDEDGEKIVELSNMGEGVVSKTKGLIIYSKKPVNPRKFIAKYGDTYGYREADLPVIDGSGGATTYLPNYKDVKVLFRTYTGKLESSVWEILGDYGLEYYNIAPYINAGYNYMTRIYIDSLVKDPYDLEIYYGKEKVTTLKMEGITKAEKKTVLKESVYTWGTLANTLKVNRLIKELRAGYEKKYKKSAKNLDMGEMIRLMDAYIGSFPYKEYNCGAVWYMVEVAKYYGAYGMVVYNDSEKEYYRNLQPTIYGSLKNYNAVHDEHTKMYFHTIGMVIYEDGYMFGELNGNMANNKSTYLECLPEDYHKITEFRMDQTPLTSVDEHCIQIASYKSTADFWKKNYKIDVHTFDPYNPDTWY